MMKAERFTGVIFLCVIMLFLCMAVSEFTVRKINHLFDPEPIVEPIIIDWEKLYPFADGKTRKLPEKKESLINRVKSKFENYASKYLAVYQRIVEAARKYEDIMHWNMAAISGYNPVIKLNDGYMTNFIYSRDVTTDAEAVKGFADFCKDTGVEFMYINLPIKICPSEDKDISGILDFTNQNADKFLFLLKESGVRYYDFRKALHDAGMNHHEAFYITDHHWKAETGLWAAGRVLEILRDNYGWPVKPEIVAPENFRYEVYPDWFLGSQGKKLTLSRSKPEDFTLIYPKFETRIKFEVSNAGINTEGDLSITYDMQQVEPKDHYDKNPYATYIYADRPLIRIENKLNTEGRKILVIHESFSNCVIPFIVAGVQYVFSIDLRHFTGSVKSFIETEKPNIVIVMYHSGVPGRIEESNTMYNLD